MTSRVSKQYWKLHSMILLPQHKMPVRNWLGFTIYPNSIRMLKNDRKMPRWRWNAEQQQEFWRSCTVRNSSTKGGNENKAGRVVATMVLSQIVATLRQDDFNPLRQCKRISVSQ